MSGFLCAMVGASFTVAAAAEVLRSKKGITAVGNAQVSTAQSQFGGASAAFDGTGDALLIDHQGSMRFGTGDFSMEFWYRPTSRATNYPVIFSNRNGFSSGNIVFHDRHASNTSKLTVWIYNLSAASPIFTTTTTTVNGTWYHIALTRSGTSLKLFVNGTQEGSTYTTSANIDTGAGSDLYYLSFPGSDSEYNGFIDEVRVSNTARYTANFTPSTTAFVNDANTLLLIHANGTNASTFFEDDNGTGRSQVGIIGVSTAQIDTAQSKFGGSSLYLDGNWSTTNAMLNVGNSSNIPITSGNWTIECWIRLPATNLTGLIISPYGASATNNFILYHDNTDLLFYAFGATRITASAVLSANTWHHVAVSKSGSSTRMFKDGTQVGSTYTDNNTYTASGFGIGTSFESAGGSSNYEGWIDEVRVSNSARYTTTFTPSTTPFVNDANTLVLIHMDGTDGSTVFRDDNGARAQQGIVAVGNAQIDTAQSKFGGASALFDGTGDYLTSTNSNLLTLGTGNWTIECYYRISTLVTDQYLISFLGGPSTHWGINIYTGQWRIGVITGTTNGTTGIDTGNWHHAALVRDSATNLTFYVDGAVVSTKSISAGDNYDSTLFVLGQYSVNLGYDAELNGHLDEVRVSNTARYTAAFTPSTTSFQSDANTLLLLHMDGTDGSTVFTDDNGIAPYTP